MKRVFLFLSCFMFIIPVFVKAEDVLLAPKAKSVLVMEPSTGSIIYERNSHEKLHPASMTKMMTMLLIIESVEKGIINLDDMVTVSSNASSMGGSQILLETGEKMSVNDLLKGIAVASGNDAAVAMAEKIGGTEEAFVAMMNERAKELGLNDTNFKNVHGLDDVNHYSSAYDMAMIAKELVKHPKILEFTSIYEDYLRKGTDRAFWLVNTNKLVRFYDGVDGLKTGYTSEAGHCLTATANINDMRIITVVMGEPDSNTRSSEVSSIFDYVYAQYALDKVVTKDTDLGEYDVDKGKVNKIKVAPIEDVTILHKKAEKMDNVTYDIEVDKLIAPINIGNLIGKLTLKQNGVVIKSVPLTVSENVSKANIFEVFWKNLKDTLSI
ncbi:MAG: D-alanyl-D-alanine carboxypeptidase family protein [Candidatus Faecisoma sp.]|nr:D-alanyl-D-alanine carboxypeptidase [Acholeplasma sp.]MDY2892345.1 D-alanyl-D-alanine carboxypeptidase family protein [Candidatus Faecisoma sp.]